MFTGIIECTGLVQKCEKQGSNSRFWISAPIAGELSPDQSVAHNGVCLTVEEVNDSQYRVTAIDETLQKTNLGGWQPGTVINIERCLQMNGRLDGHLVQGHADGTATCLEKKELDGSHAYRFRFDAAFAPLVIEKGSIAVNGISLTCFNVSEDSFTVAIIPYTFDHTNMRSVVPGDTVNIEFDVIGKYVQRTLHLRR